MTKRKRQDHALKASRRPALRRISGLLLAPFASGALTFGSWRARAEEVLRPIRFGLQTTVAGAPGVVWARQRVYERRNLKVESFRFPDGRAVRDALLAGKIDMGTMNITPFLAGAATGSLSLIAIALLGGNTTGLMVAKDAGITKVNELKGKNVSITVGSALGNIFVQKVGPSFGLYPGGYKLINLRPADQVAALSAGSIIAFVGPEPYLIIGEAENVGRVLLRFAKFDLNPTLLVASVSFIERYPNTVITLLKSWLDGMEFWKRSRAAVAETLLDLHKEGGYLTLTRAMMEKMVDLIEAQPDITPEIVKYVKEQADIAVAAGQLKVLPNWEKALRPDLLAKARAQM